VATGTQTQRALLFALCGKHYALDVSSVAGLAACSSTRTLPGAPRAVLGLVEWRGTVLTALDLPHVLGHEAGAGPACLVRLARPMQRVALLVPAGLQMVEISATLEPPDDDELLRQIGRGWFEHAGRPVCRIDPQPVIRLVESQLREST
jgi:chemotaxis signal transduction protein